MNITASFQPKTESGLFVVRTSTEEVSQDYYFTTEAEAHKFVAQVIVRNLTPEQAAYASSAERGEYRGFTALHDLMDANALLPDFADWQNTTEQVERSNAIMDSVTEILCAS